MKENLDRRVKKLETEIDPPIHELQINRYIVDSDGRHLDSTRVITIKEGGLHEA